MILSLMNIHAIGKNGKNMLMRASSKGRIDVVKLIISKFKIENEQWKKKQWTRKCKQRRTQWRRQMLKQKRRRAQKRKQLIRLISVSDRCERTALMHASLKGHTEVVRFLLGKGSNIDATDTYGNNSLVHACIQGHTEVVRLLLEKGAVPNCEKTYLMSCMTTLQIACHMGYPKIVQLLLEHGANIEKTNRYGETMLIIAAKMGRLDVLRVLLKHGANIEKRDKYGRTPLMHACSYPEIVRFLVGQGASLFDLKNLINSVYYFDQKFKDQLCRYKMAALRIKHFLQGVNKVKMLSAPKENFYAGDDPRIILQKIREEKSYTVSSDGPCETKNGPHTFFKQQNELLSDKPVAFEIQVGYLVCVISNRRDHAMFQRRGDIRSFELLNNTQRYSSHQFADKTRDQIQNKKVNETRKRSKLDNCMQNNFGSTFSGWPLVQ